MANATSRAEFRAIYRIESPEPLDKVAEVIAGEQSSGTFLALAGETEDLKARAREISGGGVDVVVDPVGADRFLDSLRLLRPEGRLVVVGFAGGEIPTLKVNRLLLRNITVMGAAWREFLAHDPGFVAKAGAELRDLVASGRLVPVLGATYPLEDGAQALRDLAARRAVGKLVLTVR